MDAFYPPTFPTWNFFQEGFWNTRGHNTIEFSKKRLWQERLWQEVLAVLQVISSQQMQVPQDWTYRFRGHETGGMTVRCSWFLDLYQRNYLLSSKLALVHVRQTCIKVPHLDHWRCLAAGFSRHCEPARWLHNGLWPYIWWIRGMVVVVMAWLHWWQVGCFSILPVGAASAQELMFGICWSSHGQR